MTTPRVYTESCSNCGQIFTSESPAEVAKMIRTHACPKIGIASDRPVEVVHT
jgi:hypothetical protein